ncbi:MAG TPA: hypothetical protein VK155_17360 [Bacteroidales bacterium]|nr:hypothetical protein [Bacteroidales bacterium]
MLHLQCHLLRDPGVCKIWKKGKINLFLAHRAYMIIETRDDDGLLIACRALMIIETFININPLTGKERLMMNPGSININPLRGILKCFISSVIYSVTLVYVRYGKRGKINLFLAHRAYMIKEQGMMTVSSLPVGHQ